MSRAVDVLMSVHNGEKYLRGAIESVLNQTFTDFEFIIINDGSTDGTGEILQGYEDSRIKLVSNKQNIGLTKSLNIGLRLGSAKYIARMDADDMSGPNRLQKQVDYLDRHPEAGILGSWCAVGQGSEPGVSLRRVPLSDLGIRWTSLLSNPFIHPTVMMRRQILVQNELEYDERLSAAQDYELWTRMLRFTHGANLNMPLLRYRLSSYSITTRHRAMQLKNHDIIALRTIREQLPEIDMTLERVSQLRALFVGGIQFIFGLNASQLDTRRVALSETYLDMFKAFECLHHGDPGLKSLRRQEVLRVADIVFRRPLRRGWGRVVGRLMTMEPRFFLLYSFSRFGRRTLNFLHSK